MGSMMKRAGVPDDFPDWAQKVNIHDAKSIWHALDDKLLHLVEEAGYQQDQWVSNMKIGFGLAAISVAIVSIVWPVPFPANRLVLAVCVALYALFSGLMQALMSYVEKDCIFLSLPDENGRRIRLRTHLNGEAEYLVVAECIAGLPNKGGLRHHITAYTSSSHVVCTRQRTFSVGRFFDERGILYVKGVQAV